MKKAKISIGFLTAVIAIAIMAAPMSSNAAGSNLFKRSSGLGDLFVLDELFSGTLNNPILSDNNQTDLGDLFILDQLFPVEEAVAAEVSIAQQLAGRIVLQVEENGEAWYISPKNLTRTELGSPNSAFNYIKTVVVGINNADFDSYNGTAPARLSGMFLLKTEDNGKIVYVNPVGRSMIEVDGPSGADALMKVHGLGITNSNISKITIAK